MRANNTFHVSRTETYFCVVDTAKARVQGSQFSLRNKVVVETSVPDDCPFLHFCGINFTHVPYLSGFGCYCNSVHGHQYTGVDKIRRNYFACNNADILVKLITRRKDLKRVSRFKNI